MLLRNRDIKFSASKDHLLPPPQSAYSTLVSPVPKKPLSMRPVIPTFLNLKGSLSYLTSWRPLLPFATLPTLEASVVVIPPLLDSCSHHTAISGCMFSLSRASLSFWTVKEISERVGWYSNCFHLVFSHKKWYWLFDNKNWFASATARLLFVFLLLQISQFN